MAMRRLPIKSESKSKPKKKTAKKKRSKPKPEEVKITFENDSEIIEKPIDDTPRGISEPPKQKEKYPAMKMLAAVNLERIEKLEEDIKSLKKKINTDFRLLNERMLELTAVKSSEPIQEQGYPHYVINVRDDLFEKEKYISKLINLLRNRSTKKCNDAGFGSTVDVAIELQNQITLLFHNIVNTVNQEAFR